MRTPLAFFVSLRRVRPGSWLLAILAVPLLLFIAQVVRALAEPPLPLDLHPDWAQPHRVELAHCGRGELLALPGVGPVLAGRILAERARRPFTSLDDLRRVSGVGPTVLARIEKHVTLSRRSVPP